MTQQRWVDLQRWVDDGRVRALPSTPEAIAGALRQVAGDWSVELIVEVGDPRLRDRSPGNPKLIVSACEAGSQSRHWTSAPSAPPTTWSATTLTSAKWPSPSAGSQEEPGRAGIWLRWIASARSPRSSWPRAPWRSPPGPGIATDADHPAVRVGRRLVGHGSGVVTGDAAGGPGHGRDRVWAPNSCTGIWSGHVRSGGSWEPAPRPRNSAMNSSSVCPRSASRRSKASRPR